MSDSTKHISAVRAVPRIADRADGRDNNFNLIRIIAATLVLVAHAYPLSLGGAYGQPFESVLHGLSLGMMCVWAFFAISGFFITRSFDRKPSAKAFLIARGLRLFPALAVVTLISILIAGFVLTQAPPTVFWSEAGEYFIRNMLLFKLQYDLPGVFQNNPYGPAINGSLWSLSYEVTCYVGVLICGVLGLLGHRKIFAGMAIAFLCFYALTAFVDLNPRIETLTTLGLPFLSGMVLYLWRDEIPLSWGVLAVMAALALAAWLTPLFLPVFAVALSYAVFVLGYAQWPALLQYNRLGDYSYGVYIYAFPIQQLVAQSGVTTPAINMAISLPFTLFCAVLSWHLIEAPAMKLRHLNKPPKSTDTKQAAE
ncbi:MULTISPECIES: acyltransferase [unclassified Ruegeria]|uniref:acyltransferase family protein n=1 Tax=unclassified Ruegeria TaxID=2625375 RepID=UPI0014915F4F|nr:MULTISPECIES: acyltransferase [unclassified Ruegeria]NOD90925.1 acyltransferase family protein [Ruegeria sp. HKCCD4318]NOE16313.1 acyltransferase family protein [Ruegeria sp. HKCCD4318-2]NOG11761.1 acyltransferase [Ruegeria sp. HKCCD4315]